MIQEKKILMNQANKKENKKEWNKVFALVFFF